MTTEPTLAAILAEKLDSNRSRREFFRLLALAGSSAPVVPDPMAAPVVPAAMTGAFDPLPPGVEVVPA